MINSLSVLINYYKQYFGVKRLTDSRSKLWLPLLKKRAQWLSGRVLDSRPSGRGFEPLHSLHCPRAKHINPNLVLVPPRKTCAFITERLLMVCIMIINCNTIVNRNDHVQYLTVSKSSSDNCTCSLTEQNTT